MQRTLPHDSASWAYSGRSVYYLQNGGVRTAWRFLRPNADVALIAPSCIKPWKARGEEIQQALRDRCGTGHKGIAGVNCISHRVDDCGSPSGLAGQMLHLTDAFGIPDHLLPPIARDWVTLCDTLGH